MSVPLILGMRAMVRSGGEHDYAFFPGTVCAFMKNEMGEKNGVLIVYDLIDGEKEHRSLVHPFPCIGEHEAMFHFTAYDKLPALVANVNGKFKVFIVHDLGHVDESPYFDTRPTDEQVEAIRTASILSNSRNRDTEERDYRVGVNTVIYTKIGPGSYHVGYDGPKMASLTETQLTESVMNEAIYAMCSLSNNY